MKREKVQKREKGHNSLTGYDEFEETHANIKAIRHKMRGIKSKKHEIVTYEISKDLYLVLMISVIFLMME